MEKKLLKYLEINKKDVVSLTSDLVRIPTINPPGENYEEMVQLLEERCKKLGLKTTRFITPKSVLDRFNVKSGSRRISLVADWSIGAKKKTLHINSHYDVVPATDKWNLDPFKPVIKKGKIYGRGTEDMKGNIASILFSLQAMKNCNINPNVNLQLSFTPDEEIGGLTGLGYLVKKNLVKASYAMSEGHSHDCVSIGNKGVLWAEVTVKGKAHHASIPYKGVNAFDRMIELGLRFKGLEKTLSQKKTRYHMKEVISKSPTLVMGGLLEGGVKVNVVPGKVRFSIDRRLIPEENILTAKREIQRVIKRFNDKHKDSTVRVKFIAEGEPSISKKDDNFFRVVSDSIRRVTGKNAKFSIIPGATDMRYFMWKGVPSLGYSARGGESWHSDNEFVYIDSLLETAKVYGLVMSRLK